MIIFNFPFFLVFFTNSFSRPLLNGQYELLLRRDQADEEACTKLNLGDRVIIQLIDTPCCLSFDPQYEPEKKERRIKGSLQKTLYCPGPLFPSHMINLIYSLFIE